MQAQSRGREHRKDMKAIEEKVQNVEKSLRGLLGSIPTQTKKEM